MLLAVALASFGESKGKIDRSILEKPPKETSAVFGFSGPLKSLGNTHQRLFWSSPWLGGMARPA